MERKLYIVRHAKAVDNLNDHERILTEMGVEKTMDLASFMLRNEVKIDAMYASDSSRTMQTAQILAEHLNFPKQDIHADSSLYLTTEESYFNIIVSQSEEVRNLMIIGHNPEVSTVLHFFVQDFSSYMQTAACACISFESDDWQSVFTSPHELKFYYKAI